MLPTQQKGKNNKSIIKWYRVKLKKKKLKLTQLTCGLRYKAQITQQKEKNNKSRNSRPNNSILNEKKTIFKKDPKKDRT